MNHIMLIGNVGRDPEIRTTQGGKEMASFSVATTERWKNSEGERQEKTTWHNCVVFGGLSQIVENYVQKGSKLAVSGRLNMRPWTTKEGDKRIAVEVIVDNIELLGTRPGRRDDDDEEERPKRKAPPKKTAPKKRGADLDDDLDDQPDDDLDDDIPF